MPVTLTPLGDMLEINIFDDNFLTLQDLFRSGLAKADFVGQFSRYQILRHAGGRIVSANSFSRPLLMAEISDREGKFDLLSRYGKYSKRLC